ncbi:MAG: M23 family metallopeptidase [Proteobacteria bacterium]|nr:M23 family metallopeptidase [Pseudomonadota bacterium]
MKNFTLIKHDKHGMTNYSLEDNAFKRNILLSIIGIVVVFVALGVLIGSSFTARVMSTDNQIKRFQSMVAVSQKELVEYKQAVQRDIDAMTLQIGKLIAQSTRVNALGSRLTEVAQIGLGEFNFSDEPGTGGATLELSNEQNTATEVYKHLFSLQNTIEHQQENLNIIADLLNEQALDDKSKPNNNPLEGGWKSSHYGTRIDPFTGKKANHSGVDFSGKYDAAIKAAADGIIIYSGNRGSYGLLVEIDHGNGFVTRYAHAKSLNVKLGQKVNSGDQIAVMGKSGRATSEHLHFEVLKNGKRINPFPFIKS